MGCGEVWRDRVRQDETWYGEVWYGRENVHPKGFYRARYDWVRFGTA